MNEDTQKEEEQEKTEEVYDYMNEEPLEIEENSEDEEPDYCD